MEGLFKVLRFNNLFFSCKDEVIHREFKKQSGASCVYYNDELAVLVVLVSSIVCVLFSCSAGFLLRSLKGGNKFFIAGDRSSMIAGRMETKRGRA